MEPRYTRGAGQPFVEEPMPTDSESPIPTSITIETIWDARDRIAPYIHWTPVFTSETLSGLTGTRLHFKAENLQKTGNFKARGALNSLALLDPEVRARGVITYSSGNHAQAVAMAARRYQVAADIFMPGPFGLWRAGRARGGGALPPARRRRRSGRRR